MCLESIDPQFKLLMAVKTTLDYIVYSSFDSKQMKTFEHPLGLCSSSTWVQQVTNFCLQATRKTLHPRFQRLPVKFLRAQPCA